MGGRAATKPSMSIRFYTDHDVRGAVITGLRLRDVDIERAFGGGSHEMGDSGFLDISRSIATFIARIGNNLIQIKGR